MKKWTIFCINLWIVHGLGQIYAVRGGCSEMWAEWTELLGELSSLVSWISRSSWTVSCTYHVHQICDDWLSWLRWAEIVLCWLSFSWMVSCNQTFGPSLNWMVSLTLALMGRGFERPLQFFRDGEETTARSSTKFGIRYHWSFWHLL